MKRTTSIIAACLLAGLAGAADFSAWRYYTDIEFAGYTRSETLTNFPVLVQLGTNTVSGYSPTQSLCAASAGCDVRFTLSDGTTELNYEKELWSTSAATNSLFWVRIPALTSATRIRCYWGMATNGPVYATNGAAWDSTFRGVWHFTNGTTTTVVSDSSSNANHSTSITNITVTAGKVGGAGSWDGSTSIAVLPNSASLRPTNTWAVSAWMWQEGSTTPRSMFSSYSQTEGVWGIDVGTKIDGSGYNEKKICAVQGWGKVGPIMQYGIWHSTVDVVDGNWHHVTLSSDAGAVVRIYVDGSTNQATIGPDQLIGFPSYATPSFANIGCEQTNSAMTSIWKAWSGYVDELRFSGTYRSENWAWAEYQTMANPTTFGTYYPMGVPYINATNGATNASMTTATVRGTLTSTGMAQTVVWLYYGTADGGHVPSAWATAVLQGTNAAATPVQYSVNLTGLLGDTPYYYRFAASNAYGITWSEAVTFQTTVNPADSPYKMKITFAGYNRTETLTNFQVLVSLSTNLSGFTYSQFCSVAGYDLRFMEATETVSLNYEVERWNTNGTSSIWVQVPAVTSNGYIWAYWGSSVLCATPAVYTTNGAAWGSTYKGVWHMASNVLDSTANKINGSNYGTMGYASGPVDAGRAFGGTSDYVGLNSNPWSGISTFTLSWWMMQSDHNQGAQISGDSGLGANRFICQDNISAPGYYPVYANGVVFPGGTAPYYIDSKWHHYSLTVASTNGGAWKFYTDGVLKDSQNWSFAMNAAQEIQFGKHTTVYFAGRLDEIRCGLVARSANWVWADFQSVASNSVFNSYGAVSQTGTANILAARRRLLEMY